MTNPNICEDCDERYCGVCLEKEERKWAAHFANDRSTHADPAGAYDDYKSTYAGGW